MSTLLAVDSSTSACSVAVMHGGNVIEEFVIAPQDHTKRLLPMVDQVLAEAGLRLNQLDAIAFASGPGSFTGLRICLGTVQGLAFGADLPVVPISTLSVMAASAIRLQQLSADTVIIPALDARMSEVYWAMFNSLSSSDTALMRSAPDAVATPDDCVKACQVLLSQFPAKNIVTVGSGWALTEMSLFNAADVATEQITSDPEFCPHAYDLALLAAEHLKDHPGISIFDATPTYIRNEVSWVKRQKIRSS